MTGLLIVVDPRSGVPVYRQLMDQVKFHVASGLLQAGDELPSTRQLSTELGVNPMTISKAYSWLERDGVVERRPGRPLVVKALSAPESDAHRLDQLRRALVPLATMAQQLSIPADRATELFKQVLVAQGQPDADATEEQV